MKIIKQNDSAGGLIFKQNTGGKAMKQNYNFGNAIYNAGINTIYIEVPYMVGRSTSQDMSVFMYLKNKRLTQGGFFQILNAAGHLFQASTDAFVDTHRFDYVTAVATGLRSSPGKYINIAAIVSNKSVTAFLNNSSQTGVVPTGVVVSNITKFRIGISGNRGNSTLSIYMTSSIATFEYYERALPASEVTYRYSGGLGREVFSTNKLLLKYDFLYAEILDFSELQDGSDMRVGIKNTGSVLHAHAEIVGLPVGSLQDKLTYANANLFERW